MFKNRRNMGYFQKPIDFQDIELAQKQSNLSLYSLKSNQSSLSGDESHSFHCSLLFGTIFFIISAACISIIYAYPSKDGHTFSGKTTLFILCLIYLIYILFAYCCNPLLKQLYQIKDQTDFLKEYEDTRQFVGAFKFQAVCYHYDNRKIVHDRYQTLSSNISYQTKKTLISHHASKLIEPSKTEDLSKQIVFSEIEHPIVVMNYTIQHIFDSLNSENHFKLQFEAFKQQNNRDTHQSYTCTYVMPKFEKKVTISNSNSAFSMKICLYLFSLIGLAWPYSLWLETRICRIRGKYIKRVTIL